MQPRGKGGTPLSRFFRNGCLLIFPGLLGLPGIVSLKLFHFAREKENGLCWSCFVPVGTAVVLSWADTVGEEAITVALALTKTLHLQGEEEITPQWCLTLLPHLGSWALGPVNGYTTTATMAVIQSHKRRATNQQLERTKAMHLPLHRSVRELFLGGGGVDWMVSSVEHYRCWNFVSLPWF